MRILQALLLLSSFISTLSTGKGPVGLTTITQRYSLIADSSLDALLIIDVEMGGIVGHLILHDRQYDLSGSDYDKVVGGKWSDVDKDGWMDPTGVSTCPSCNFVFVTSSKLKQFYKIRLDRPLKEMANNDDGSADFSSFSQSEWSAITAWPDATSTERNLRMTTIMGDGDMGFVVDLNLGIYSFDPFEDDHPHEADVQLFLPANKLSNTPRLSGCNMDASGSKLIVTSKSEVIIVHAKHPEKKVVVVNVSDLCAEDGRNMHFRDAVLLNDDLFVMGNAAGNSEDDSAAMALYKLTNTKVNDDEAMFLKCEVVAGDISDEGRWRDGVGADVRFTRPHAMLLRPDASGLLITDIDNRALRLAKVGKYVGHVSTISYNEDNLFARLYMQRDPYTQSTRLLDSGVIKEVSAIRADGDCKEAGYAGLCTLPELRSKLVQSQNQISQTAKTVVWTDQSCASCWLNYPGYCGDPTETVNDAEWGSQYQMVATLMAGRMNTECLKRTEEVRIESMCCGVGTGIDTSKSSPSPKSSVFDNEQPKSSHKGKTISIMLVIACMGAVGVFLYRRDYNGIDENYDATAVSEEADLQLETITVSDRIEDIPLS